MNQLTSSNKLGWNGLAAIHSKTYHLQKLMTGEPLLNDLIQKEVGNVKGKTLVHLLCHIGSDTLSWALLGARVTGIDISPESIKVARSFAQEMKIDAEFIEADILEVNQKVHQKYDIVFSSTGVLCWLPDINIYAQTVRQLLNNDGFFYILDGHPFRNVFIDEKGESNSNNFVGDYFKHGPWQYNGMGDYTDPQVLIPFPSYEWAWTMGDIVTAFCQAGLHIEFLHEFPQYFYNGYTPYDVEEEKVEKFPCTFSLKASLKL